MFAIAPTDNNWFNLLKEREYNSYINFWTPTPWNITGLKPNDKWYFMLKSPIRKIGGFGEFVEYKNLTAENAWKEFGYRNGRISKDNFFNSIQNYIDRNSQNFGGKNLNAATYEIGCIILKNCQFWNEYDYKNPTDYDVLFPSQIVKFKYFDIYDPFIKSFNEVNDFEIISEPRNDKRYLIQSRNGQSIFKGRILKAYNNKCCITGESIPELLEAAHIQEYRNSSSNHTQNGLLLRIDIHRLFDNNLIFIDRDYTIHISSQIENEYYRKYHGKIISIPTLEIDYPSKEALELRRNEFRN